MPRNNSRNGSASLASLATTNPPNAIGFSLCQACLIKGLEGDFARKGRQFLHSRMCGGGCNCRDSYVYIWN